MKRYSKKVVDHRYSEMQEDALGEWVPADVAQVLYDALILASESVPPYDFDKFKVIDSAIALADGEEDNG